ncbi:MAG: ABC transporter permease [Pirellulales bacterium]|nr:ABC transporter permease [Pirellulales bacterium]
MIVFLLRRAAQVVLTTLVALVLVFIAIRLLPNNPVLARFGQHAVPDQVAAEMARQGWDRPLPEQLAAFVSRLVRDGDLGESFFYPERVTAGLARTFPATVELALAALLVALPIGIGAGVAAAVWRNRWPDFVCTSGSLLGVSVPVFFLGICLMSVFRDLPTGRRLPPGASFVGTTQFIALESLLRGQFDVFLSALEHLLLPALALATIPASLVARVTRAAMIEVLAADYVRTARAKGGSPLRVVLHHAFPNAAIPVANIAALQAGQLLSGAVLTESVFDWPGLGRHLVQAVQVSDFSVVQGGVLLVAAVFVVVNVAADALYAVLDPRVRGSGEIDG